MALRFGKCDDFRWLLFDLVWRSLWIFVYSLSHLQRIKLRDSFVELTDGHKKFFVSLKLKFPYLVVSLVRLIKVNAYMQDKD